MADEIKQDSERLMHDLETMRLNSARRTQHDAGTSRSSRLHGIASARAGSFERIRQIASETQNDVDVWNSERRNYEDGYMAYARSSRREVESTRRRLREAREANLLARAANAQAVRATRLAVHHDYVRKVEEEASNRRALHDRIAQAKLATPR